MSFLDHIEACNRATLDNFVPFCVDDVVIGHIHQNSVKHLVAHPEVFQCRQTDISLAVGLVGFEDRSAEIANVVRKLTSDGVIPRGDLEYYPAAASFGAPPLFKIDRAAIQFFGISAYGVHVNGFVLDVDGGISMWIGRRGNSVRICAGMLDNMVAGGQPIGLGLLDNVVKEAEEEAGIPGDLAKTARAVGSISYVMETERGLRPDTMFCFDLEVPSGFTPVCQDGSVMEYYLWPIAKVAEIVETSFEFKFNCNLVIIDFLIRHGFIDCDHPDLAALKARLRN